MDNFVRGEANFSLAILSFEPLIEFLNLKFQMHFLLITLSVVYAANVNVNDPSENH